MKVVRFLMILISFCLKAIISTKDDELEKVKFIPEKDYQTFYREIKKEIPNSTFPKIKDQLKVFPSLKELNKELKWDSINNRSNITREISGKILFQTLYKHKNQFLSQKFLVSRSCPPFKVIKNAPISKLNTLHLKKYKQAVSQFVLIFMKWYKLMPIELKSQNNVTSVSDKHVEEVIEFFKTIKKEWNEFDQTYQPLYDEIAKMIEVNNCQIKDYMAFYGLLPRFYYLYKNCKYSSVRNTIYMRLTNLQSRWKVRLESVSQSLKILHFLITCFREMTFYFSYKTVGSILDENYYIFSMIKMMIKLQPRISFNFHKFEVDRVYFESKFFDVAKYFNGLEDLAGVQRQIYKPIEPENHISIIGIRNMVMIFVFFFFWRV